MQDEYEDWKRQAVQMASIYSRSYVTIAATASASDEEGCFRTATNDTNGHEIIVSGTKGKTCTLRIRAEVQTHWTAMPNEMMAEMDFGELGDSTPPLFTRAWCFQERLLSPRYLRFDEWEMSWSCRETETCSCGYLDTVIGPVRGGREHSHPFLLDHEVRKPSDPAELWREAVYAYGSLLLTYEKDRLPAIAALAERHGMSLRPGDRYLAGLWLSSFIADMLWLTTAEGPSSSGDERQLPSWSWGTRQQASYMFAKLHVLARVVEVKCEPLAGLHFTQFHPGAYAVLSGITVNGTLISKAPHHPDYVKFQAHEDQIAPMLWSRKKSWLGLDVSIVEMAGAEVTLIRMAYFEAKKPGRVPSLKDEEYWIILQSSVRSGGGFQRIGIAVFEPLSAQPLDLPETIIKIF